MDNDTKVKAFDMVVFGLALLIVISVVVLGFGYILTTFVQSAPMPTPTPTLIPTVTPTPEPTTTVTTFTALYCTLANGYYQVYTTDGRDLHIADYAAWDQIIPQGTYVGEIRDGKVSGIHLLGHSPQYYQYDDRQYETSSWYIVRRHYENRTPGYGAASPDIPYGSGNPYQAVP